MYNGIGLSTPRGSGTNGYVQRNLSHVIERRNKVDYHTRGGSHSQDSKEMGKQPRTPNADILLHEQKRKIEVKCLKLQFELESKGVSPNSIESEVDDLRQTLLSSLHPSSAPSSSTLKGSSGKLDTHQGAALKEKETLALASALGIQSSKHEPGQAFDTELQQEKKLKEKEKKLVQWREREKKSMWLEEQKRRKVLKIIVHEIQQGKRHPEDLKQAEEEMGMTWSSVTAHRRGTYRRHSRRSRSRSRSRSSRSTPPSRKHSRPRSASRSSSSASSESLSSSPSPSPPPSRRRPRPSSRSRSTSSRSRRSRKMRRYSPSTSPPARRHRHDSDSDDT